MSSRLRQSEPRQTVLCCV